MDGLTVGVEALATLAGVCAFSHWGRSGSRNEMLEMFAISLSYFLQSRILAQGVCCLPSVWVLPPFVPF